MRDDAEGRGSAMVSERPPRESLASSFGAPIRREDPPRRDFDEEAEQQRSTTISIAASLIPGISAVREQQGWTVGELIIQALEATHERLPGHLYPQGRIGGGLFAARGPARAAQSASSGARTKLNFRLPMIDFEVIDRQVDLTAARSRGHLIETALRLYLADYQSTTDDDHSED